MEKSPSALSRRALMSLAAAGGLVASAGLWVPRAAAADERPSDGDEDGAKEVGAVEDLMREHGVLRRALIVFRESARRLKQGDTVPTGPLADTAELFREFGEDYHERELEEQHIFPVVKAHGGPAAALVDVLLDQHRRGREITDFIATSVAGGDIATARRQPLADAMDAFARMYEAHAAREDTVVFPAWKRALSAARIQEAGERFEEIEHRQFGSDGFEDAVARIGRIERVLGLHDLSVYTAPEPPGFQ